MKDECAAFHALDPALLLVPSPLQPAVYCNYFGHRETLGLEDPLGLWAFLPRIQLGDPHADRTVCAA
jgi:hypothetical protein